MAEDDGPGKRDISLHVSRFSANIVEGQGRLSSGECKQFLGQARGSPLEVETQVLIAQELGHLGTTKLKVCVTSPQKLVASSTAYWRPCPAEGSLSGHH